MDTKRQDRFERSQTPPTPPSPPCLSSLATIHEHGRSKVVSSGRSSSPGLVGSSLGTTDSQPHRKSRGNHDGSQERRRGRRSDSRSSPPSSIRGSGGGGHGRSRSNDRERDSDRDRSSRSHKYSRRDRSRSRSRARSRSRDRRRSRSRNRSRDWHRYRDNSRRHKRGASYNSDQTDEQTSEQMTQRQLMLQQQQQQQQLQLQHQQALAASRSNAFKNDGSFMEMFKKMQEQMQPPAEPSNAVLEEKTVVPPPLMVGKRRGGRILKTGMVAKPKTEQTVDQPKDAWSLYMAEVKKYREVCCQEEDNTRPLVNELINVATMPEINSLEEIHTIPFDPRFPNQNQTRNCYQNFLDFHRCSKVRGEDYPACQYFKKAFKTLCPNDWHEKWTEQIQEGTFPGRI